MNAEEIVTQGIEIADLKVQQREKSQPLESALSTFARQYIAQAERVVCEYRDLTDAEFGTATTMGRKLREFMMRALPFPIDAKFELESVGVETAKFRMTSEYQQRSCNITVLVEWLRSDIRDDVVSKLVRKQVKEYISFNTESVYRGLAFENECITAWEEKNASRIIKRKKVPGEIQGKQKRIEFLKTILADFEKLAQYVEKKYATADAE